MVQWHCKAWYHTFKVQLFEKKYTDKSIENSVLYAYAKKIPLSNVKIHFSTSFLKPFGEIFIGVNPIV